LQSDERMKRERCGRRKARTSCGHKGTHKGPEGPSPCVIPQYTTSFVSHEEIAVRPEHNAMWPIEPPAATWDKRVDERPRVAVVTQNIVGNRSTDVEISVQSKCQSHRLVQTAGPTGDEDAFEGSCHAVILQDAYLIRYIKISVRS